MTGAVRVLASPAVAAGFRLAGLAAVGAAPGTEAATQVQRLAGDPTCGILLVEQPLLDALPGDLRDDLERRPLPLLVPIPPPAWEEGATGAEDYILDLLQRAIGYRVRLQ